MKRLLVVTADTNDADYVYKVSDITDEQLERMRPVFRAIRDFKPYKGKVLVDEGTSYRLNEERTAMTHGHNWPVGDYEFIPRADLGEKTVEEIYEGILSPELIQEFNENFLPYSEYGVHTIKNIRLLSVDEDVDVLETEA